MIDLLVNPASSSNFARIDNGEINDLLAQIETDTNIAQNYQYYEGLQYLIHYKYYYHISLIYDKLDFIHAKSLKCVPYNYMSRFY